MGRQWLGEFLESRGLAEPDDRLLCEYACEDEEYRSLVHILELAGCPTYLRKTFSYGVPLEDQEPDAEDEHLTMAAFALYGSEWFRREWGGETRGVWRRLMNEIAWPADEYWELYPAMSTGLAWWNHSFIEIIKTQYLGTFAYQAGVAKVTGVRD